MTLFEDVSNWTRQINRSEKVTDDEKKQFRRFHRDILSKIETCLSDKRLYNERQARNYLGGISRATLYQLHISKVKIGRRTFWEISDLDKYIDGLKDKGNNRELNG